MAIIDKSTIIPMISNALDLMETEPKTITNTVVQSPFVNIDKTSYILNGLMVWAWTIASEKNIAIIMNKSRGAYVMDTYVGKFDDVAVTDGYPVYKRFDPGGMHQRCWRTSCGLLNTWQYISETLRESVHTVQLLKIISTAMQVYDMRLNRLYA